MSNKTVFVPVDPEGFGCGLLLGLIIHYWRELLIGCALIFGCAFGVSVVQYISESIQSNITAKQNADNLIVQATANAGKQALIQKGLSRIRQLQAQGATMILNKRIDFEYGDYITIEKAYFSPSGIRLYLDAQAIQGKGELKYSSNTLMFTNGDQENRNTGANPIYIEITAQDFEPHPPGYVINGSTKFHYSGYLEFSYSIFPNDINTTDNENYYLGYEYYFFWYYWQDVLLFNLTEYESWIIQ